MFKSEPDPPENPVWERNVTSRFLSTKHVWKTKGYLLEHSPSRADGVTEQMEHTWLSNSMRLVKVACQRLNL